MAVSVITPAYNAGRYVARAVESALGQPQVSEVILVEDGSTDDTLEQCRWLVTTDTRVKLFRHPGGENRGAGASRTLGLQMATQSLIAFLDADDFYLPGRFDVAMKCLLDPTVDGVYEAIGVAYESEQARQRFHETRGQSISPVGLTTIRAGIAPENLFHALLRGAGFCSLDGLTIRRKVIASSGVFNEKLRLHQDYHFLLRLAYFARLVPGSLDRAVAMRWVHGANRITQATREVSLPYMQLLWRDLIGWGLRQQMPRPIFGSLLHSAFRDTRRSAVIQGGYLASRLRKAFEFVLWLGGELRVAPRLIVSAIVRFLCGPHHAVSRRPYVAVVMTEFPSSSQTFVEDQIRGLMKRNIQVGIFPLTRTTTPEVIERSIRLGLTRRVRYPLNRRRSRVAFVFAAFGNAGVSFWRNLPALWRLARNDGGLRLRRIVPALPFLGSAHRYDIIHVHSGHRALQLMPLFRCGLFRGRKVVTFHGHDLQGFLHTRPAGIYQPLFAIVDSLIANGPYVKALLLSLGAPSHKIRLIPNGVRIDDIPFHARRPPILGEPFRIITVGRLVEFKGIHYGIEATALLRAAGCSVEYIIVGGGPLRQPLVQLALSLGVADIVKFRGALAHDETLALLQSAHVFLSPGVIAENGDCETQGVALLEAQASGLPIVATRVGGVAETVAQGSAGFLTDPGSAEVLAAALRRVLQHPERWASWGELGRNHVASNYDQGQMMELLVQHYHDLIKHQPRTGGP